MPSVRQSDKFVPLDFSRKPGQRARMKKLLVGVVLLGLLALGLWTIAAGAVDRLLNRTGSYKAAQASDRARALAKTLRIVDLHADTLLWGRAVDERATYGHVDVPRLVEGNVFVQAFTVV